MDSIAPPGPLCQHVRDSVGVGYRGRDFIGVVAPVIARREQSVLFLPVGATPDADQAARVGQPVRHALDLRAASAPLRTAW